VALERRIAVGDAQCRIVVSLRSSTPSPASGAAGPGPPLTPREREIVVLVAQGLTGREIARELTISAKTVERHLTNVRAKLGVRDRVGVARYAIRHGLVAA
jgi:DNA-binding NarL/FixJ family response regulator